MWFCRKRCATARTAKFSVLPRQIQIDKLVEAAGVEPVRGIENTQVADFEKG